MAIFSRRVLQRLIDENDRFLLQRQTKDHVNALNRMGKELSLAREWEIVLLNVLSKVGKVTHEKKFGGRRNADIYFEIIQNHDHNFVADITAVSDKGLEENNPFEYLSNELANIAKANSIRPNSFDLYVGAGDTINYRGGPKVSLKLPGRARFGQTIFNERFRSFIDEISQQPAVPHRFTVKTIDFDVVISYDPNQQYRTGRHRAYTEVYSLTENAVYQALYSKAEQLTDTNFKGPLGIFLCDGGCSFFQMDPAISNSYSIREVIQDFLSNNKEITFVVTLTINEEKGENNNIIGRISSINTHNSNFITSLRLYKGIDFDKDIRFDMTQMLKNLLSVFPEPEDFPRNAIYLLKGRKPNEGRSHWGGFSMNLGHTSTRVKISSRALLDLLSGKVGQKEFFERHRFIQSDIAPSPAMNPFESALHRGELIDSVSIEKSDSDDDWIIFELRGPDPAISPFVVPSANSKLSRNSSISDIHNQP